MKDLYEIHQEFKKSAYGKTLSNAVRFKCFKPDDVSNEEWVKILGADVHNLNHMDLMRGFTKALLEKALCLSEEEKDILIKTAQIHDWAEAITGDKPKPKKTKVDETKEKAILIALMEEFNVEDTERQKIISIIFDTNSKLFTVFQEIEEMGYLRTAILAWQRSKSTVNPNLKKHLLEMATAVTAKQLSVLIEKSKSTSQIAYFLDQNENSINDFLNTDKDESLYLTKEKWDEYIGQKPNI